MRKFIGLTLSVSLIAACSSASNSPGDAGSESGTPDGGVNRNDGGGGGDDGGAPGNDGGLTGNDGGTPGSDGAAPTEGGSGNTPFRAITLFGGGERVTGASCSDAHTCVVTHRSLR